MARRPVSGSNEYIGGGLRGRRPSPASTAPAALPANRAAASWALPRLCGFDADAVDQAGAAPPLARACARSTRIPGRASTSPTHPGALGQLGLAATPISASCDSPSFFRWCQRPKPAPCPNSGSPHASSSREHAAGPARSSATAAVAAPHPSSPREAVEARKQATMFAYSAESTFGPCASRAAGSSETSNRPEVPRAALRPAPPRTVRAGRACRPQQRGAPP